MMKKEMFHLLRDTRTLVIVAVMPVVLLLLFGFAVSTEVNNVNVALSVNRHNELTERLASRLESNDYFTFKGLVAGEDIEQALRDGTIEAAVVVDCRQDGQPRYQILVDGSNTTTAQAAVAYLEQVITADNHPSTEVVTTRTLYNPRLKSAYNFVPGIMGMIFIMICAMMTSVAIVGEKESGSMDLLTVSPARPRTVILGKLVPYFLLSCLILVFMLVVSYTLLGLPFSASIVNVVWLTLLYILLSLALGLLISAVASTRVDALMVSGIALMVPIMMLSGMIYPVDNMPLPLQWLSCIVPARWYISALRTFMIQQLPPSAVLPEITILVAMTVAAIFFAIRTLKSR